LRENLGVEQFVVAGAWRMISAGATARELGALAGLP
jgi:hypothetical protein